MLPMHINDIIMRPLLYIISCVTYCTYIFTKNKFISIRGSTIVTPVNTLRLIQYTLLTFSRNYSENIIVFIIQSSFDVSD